MKKISVLFLYCLMTTMLIAAPVGQQTAQKAGLKFLTSVQQMKVGANDFQLAYVASSELDGSPCFYVFNAGNGFVLVSGNDCAQPILGYSTQNRFDATDMPENLKVYLQSYVQQFELAKEQNIEADAKIQREWQALLSDEVVEKSVFERNTQTVAPLLTSTWSQRPFYNALCPGTGDDQAVAGCGAIAMSQIIRYWGYPASGSGIHSYTSDNYGDLSVNYSEATYQYDLMPDSLTASSSPEQVNAVATLVYHCGVGMNMDYSSAGSGAFDNAARVNFVNHFNYQNATAYALRDLCTPSDWIEMLKSDLDAERPIFYTGSGAVGGHAFVCDGYDASDYFHFNWGWGGSYNGFYALDALNPGSYSFNTGQAAILNISPSTDEDRMILHNLSGVTTQYISDDAAILDPLGFNPYVEHTYILDLPVNDQLILYPENPGDQLLLELEGFNESPYVISIYEGAGTSGTLLQVVDDEFMEPITSTTGALTLVLTSEELYPFGFAFSVAVVGESSCHELDNAFQIFPNPANAKVTVDGDNIESIAVYNVLGQMVDHVKAVNNNTISINTTSYENGAYILRITTHDGSIVSKRVVIAQ